MGVEAHGEAGGIKPGHASDDPEQNHRDQYKSVRKKHLDGPAERLFVDHEDQQIRHDDPGGQAQRRADHSQQSRLDQNHFFDLLLKRPDETQNPDFPPPLDNQRDQGVEQSQHRHADADDFQRISDGEGLVENFQHFLFEFHVGPHDNPVGTPDGSDDFLADLRQMFGILQVDHETVDVGIVVIFQVGAAVDNNQSPLLRIVVVNGLDLHFQRPGRGVQGQAVPGVHLMLQGKRFRHNGTVVSHQQFGELAGRRTLLDHQIAVTRQNVEIPRGEKGRLIVVGNRDGAEQVDRLHAGCFPERGHFIQRQGVLVINILPPGGADEQIGLQGLVDPHHHRLPKTVHHDRHADHHHERDRQRRYRHGVAPHVLRQVHAGQQAFALKPALAQSVRKVAQNQQA